MLHRREYNTKIYYWTSNTSSNVTEATDETVFITNDKYDGWQEVSSEAIVSSETKVDEPAQEQDEPNTGERPVYWERPHRRLATVTASRDRPRQLESTFG
jgi:hypothetical protein